jgi:hypothetical protein
MNPTADEYDWGNKHSNLFAPMTYKDAYRTVDQMSDREIRKLGYSGDEELLHLVSQSFMLSESD